MTRGKQPPEADMPALGPRLTVLAVASVFIGGFLTWLAIREPEPVSTPAPSIPAAPETEEQRAAAPSGTFRFYDILVNTEVPVEVEVVDDRPKDDRKVYLQVASFRDVKDAEATRVKLLMMNLEPVIETRGGWHRLIVGPFHEDRKRFVIQDQLIRQGYEYLVLRR